MENYRVYWPRAAAVLKIRWEDFGNKEEFIGERFSEISVLVKKCTIEINDYTMADTFNLEVDYKQFPFDPRCIRAVGVIIAMEDVGSNYERDNKPIKIIPKLKDPDPDRNNVVFVGFADEESISFDDSKRTVRFEGRDFTSLLVDQKYFGPPVNLENTVDVVVRELLDKLEATKIVIENGRSVKGLEVVVRAPQPLPILSTFFENKSEASGKKTSQRDESYWDLIQRIVGDAGLIAFIELDKLVITAPRILYGDEKVKRFIYGKNIKNVDFKRKIGRRKAFNIVVRAIVENDKTVETARIPLEATQEWSQETGVPQAEIKVPESNADGSPIPEKDLKAAPYIAFRLRKIKDKNHLIKVGQEVYEELGRQQIEGSLSFKDMKVPESGFKYQGGVAVEGPRAAFDVLKMRNGTPISVWIDMSDMEKIGQFTTKTQKTQYLMARKIDAKTAEFLADNLNKKDASLYTKSIRFQYDEAQGFACDIEFVNFIKLQNQYVEGR